MYSSPEIILSIKESSQRLRNSSTDRSSVWVSRWRRRLPDVITDSVQPQCHCRRTPLPQSCLTMSILHGPQPASDAAAGPRLVAVGDLVIVYERHDKMTALVVTAGGAYDNKFGNFRMDVRGSLPTADV